MARQIKDEYEMVGEIGAGGMATVYKAVQKSLGRTVAIKELKKSYHGDEQIVRRFERESKVAASLQHENIVHIYDYWKKPVYSIVMEYVDGVNLADVIEKTGALPIDVGIMIAIQVCSALDYAHMRGLVHRDIKPSNIMIKRNGEVKLMDFGIAFTRDFEALTVPGMLIGTPAYMSPEQVLGQQLDARSDIFSFGIVLYEMFTSAKPFKNDDTRSVTAGIIKDRILAPRRINKSIPWSLQRVIKKCLRKKPQRRYGAMLEVEKKLGKRLAGRTVKAASLRRISDYLVSMNVFEAAPEQETMVITGGVPGAGWYRKALLAALTAVIIASGASIYYYHTRLARAPVQPPAVPVQSPVFPPMRSAPATTAPPASLLSTTGPAPGAVVSAPSVSSESVERARERTAPERKPAGMDLQPQTGR